MPDQKHPITLGSLITSAQADANRMFAQDKIDPLVLTKSEWDELSVYRYSMRNLPVSGLGISGRRRSDGQYFCVNVKLDSTDTLHSARLAMDNALRTLNTFAHCACVTGSRCKEHKMWDQAEEGTTT